MYQGRFKSYPIQADEHLLSACRYVERNPLRAVLVQRAETWRWSSLWHRIKGSGQKLLAAGPVPLPLGWQEYMKRGGDGSGVGDLASLDGAGDAVRGR